MSGVELKEFSLLYLIMNNLDLFQENIHMIENINLFSEENKLILETLITKLKSGEKLTLDQIPIDPQLTEKIFKFASIKHILNNHQNDQNKMFELLDEVSRDLKNYDLEFRIEELESKFSKDLSESTFNEIRELKKTKKHQLNPSKNTWIFLKLGLYKSSQIYYCGKNNYKIIC